MKFLAPIVPSFAASEAQRLAERHFGLAGEIEPLYSERDQNFRVRAHSGDWTLKIASVEETPEMIDCQIRTLRHIERVDPGLPVPRVHPTHDGGSSVTVSRGADSYIVYLLSYLPGMIAEKAPMTEALLHNHGGLVARLGRAMRGFFHPAAGGRELLWDLRMAERFLPHVAKLQDPARRDMACAFSKNFVASALPRLEGMRAQLIHGDVNPHNLLVDPAEMDRITGIIDFGDMIHAPLILDLASAAGDFLLDKATIVNVIETVAAGYHAVTPLEPAEADILYDLIVMRLLQGTLIAAWRMSEAPDTPVYLHAYFDGHLQVLDELLQIGCDAMTLRIRRVCGLTATETSDGTPRDQPSTLELLNRRRRLMGRDLPLFYSPPLHLVRGQNVWLFDAEGRRYLDVYNNVAHVGHCHPRVVEAIARQARLLNTNTRYLGTQVIEYCERLAALFPGRRMVSAFVNSGSEANDIAWRMAKAYTGNSGGLTMEFAYHGITDAVDAFSPSGSRTGALAPHIRTLTAPDDYRGPFKRREADLAGRYAASADAAIASLREAGMAPAAFIVDSTFLTNGVLEAPPGYLVAVFDKVRAAGGLCIADEVQAGFGRMGKTMWGHQHYDVAPDIVTLGKPVGNGHPLGVVITTPEIMEAFLRQTAFFSTFGGNNVSSAAGLAVLGVIEEEHLIENATEIGAYLKQGLKTLMPKHGLIGDVRGIGLVVGIELVRDRRDLTPAKAETQRLLNLMRDEGVLIGSEGLHGNILKLRPPIVFSREHSDMTIAALDRAFQRL
jgi:4-aminobutyrate aminotransferase-like enzyme/Ser/Thr protein kinase RdoA (MazF antagonist)